MVKRNPRPIVRVYREVGPISFVSGACIILKSVANQTILIHFQSSISNHLYCSNNPNLNPNTDPCSTVSGGGAVKVVPDFVPDSAMSQQSQYLFYITVTLIIAAAYIRGFDKKRKTEIEAPPPPSSWILHNKIRGPLYILIIYLIVSYIALRKKYKISPQKKIQR